MNLGKIFFSGLIFLINLSIWYLYLLTLATSPQPIKDEHFEIPYHILTLHVYSDSQTIKDEPFEIPYDIPTAHVYSDPQKVNNFSRWMTEYLIWHKKGLNNEIPESERKYVLCKPINAMGNVVQVAVPCILYAMVIKI